MSSSLLNVLATEVKSDERGWFINYSLTSMSSSPLFLVQHQNLPFLRMTPDETMIEVWFGIPPRTETEENQLINSLILPSTFDLPPGSSVNSTAHVKYPPKESGYWLEKSEETIIPLRNKVEIKAKIIQGFGVSKPEHQRVRNINELFAWQLTARSQMIVLKIPPAA